MAAPTTQNEVTVRRLSTLITGVWDKVKTLVSDRAPLASPALTGTPTAPTAAAGTDSTQIATTAFVKQAVADGLSTGDAMVYKGTIAGGSTGSYGALTGAASKGWTYKVTTAGKIDGVTVEVGDLIICNSDDTAAATSSNYSTIAAKWDFVQANIDGAVVGPASVTSGQVAAFDGTTGKVIKALDAAGVRTAAGLGTASTKDVPSSGNASSTQVVLGSDTRLTNSRTPTSHASSATTYGVGTTSNYGHVKLVTGDLNGQTAADGSAASNAHTHSQYLTSHQTALTAAAWNGDNKVIRFTKTGGSTSDVAVKAIAGTNDENAKYYVNRSMRQDNGITALTPFFLKSEGNVTGVTANSWVKIALGNANTEVAGSAHLAIGCPASGAPFQIKLLVNSFRYTKPSISVVEHSGYIVNNIDKVVAAKNGDGYIDVYIHVVSTTGTLYWGSSLTLTTANNVTTGVTTIPTENAVTLTVPSAGGIALSNTSYIGESAIATVSSLAGKVDYVQNTDSSVIANNAPFSGTGGCKGYLEGSSMADDTIKMVYNVPGDESTLIFSKNGIYGSILKWGYADNYIYINGRKAGTWNNPSAWDKISAGYSDYTQYNAPYEVPADSSKQWVDIGTFRAGTSGTMFEGMSFLVSVRDDYGRTHAAYLWVSAGEYKASGVYSTDDIVCSYVYLARRDSVKSTRTGFYAKALGETATSGVEIYAYLNGSSRLAITPINAPYGAFIPSMTYLDSAPSSVKEFTYTKTLMSVLGTSIGSSTVPTYVDSNGVMQTCTPSSMAVGTATKAYQDQNGNVINTTYLPTTKINSVIANTRLKASWVPPTAYDTSTMTSEIDNWTNKASDYNIYTILDTFFIVNESNQGGTISLKAVNPGGYTLGYEYTSYINAKGSVTIPLAFNLIGSDYFVHLIRASGTSIALNIYHSRVETMIAK